MLYTYKPINHSFSKIHHFVEHLVLEVWCKPNGNYSINKLHPEFIPLVQGVKNRSFLLDPIKEIYILFRRLHTYNRSGFNKIKNGFKTNNAIQELCKGTKTQLLYADIGMIDVTLKNKLQKFFKNLYTDIPKQASFQSICGPMKTYYDSFLRLNDAEVCPFCGISDIMSPRLTKRDAFDHYLPKDIFPFNAINPQNLAPICKTCNTSYKLAKNPIRTNMGKRRKAFYPFAKKAAKLKIDATFTGPNIRALKKSEVSLRITSKGYSEEAKTWTELFGIEERYIDKFCSKEARYWLIQMNDELTNSKRTSAKRFEAKLKFFENNLMEEKNFLKIPYFKACRKLGIL